MMANIRKNNIKSSFNDAYMGTYHGDSMLIIISMLLIAFGIVMMASASIEISAAEPFFYLKKQLMFLFIGGICTWLVTKIPLSIWHEGSIFLFVCAVGALILVLIPGVGNKVNGSTRWLDLGFMSLQASEPAKLFIIIFMAWFLSTYKTFVCTTWLGFITPFIIISAPVTLLLKEPDFGAVVVLMIAIFGMMFLAGVKIYQLALTVIVAAGGAAGLIYSSSYRVGRVESFIQALSDPFNESVVYDSGYQLAQALIGFGRGEWFGVGLGNSIQKLYFLPEAHTDFVLAIIAEELGLVSVIFLLGLFLAFIIRAILIARKNEERESFFSAYLGYGIAFIFIGQILINVAVNIGLAPTKGLTLPFFSSGGSSLIICLVMLALLLRIDIENFHATRKPIKTKF